MFPKPQLLQLPHLQMIIKYTNYGKRVYNRRVLYMYKFYWIQVDNKGQRERKMLFYRDNNEYDLPRGCWICNRG